MHFVAIKAWSLLRYGGISRHPLVSELRPEIRSLVAKRFCYLPGNKATYLRIPKAANSTVARTIALHSMGEALLEKDRNGRNAKRAMRRLPSPAQFERSFSFTFVRNPAARVLSAYSDKAFIKSYQATYDLMDPTNPSQPISFEAFIGRLEDGLLYRDLHWIPQSAMIPDEGKGFDFIGRVENLDADLEKVCRRVFGTFKGLANSKRKPTNASSRIKQDISPALQKRIENLYERDYELFYS